MFPSTISALFSSVSTKHIDWHVCLGHPSDLVLKKLTKRITIPNLVCTSKCTVCTRAKAHKLPFASSTKKELDPFELVFTNLWTSLVVFVTRAQYFFFFMIIKISCGFIS